MILKIKYKDQWWIYDNVCKIRYNGLKMSRDDFTKYINRVHSIPDLVLVSQLDTSTTDLCTIEACWRDEKDYEKLVIFDEGYLCNDEGKTIERLVA